VTDWETIDPRTFNLQQGESVHVFGLSNALNQPFAASSSWAGSVLLVNTAGDRFLIELYRSSGTANNTAVYAYRYFDNGAWKST